ncbi:GntR family transcriptional regulator [Lentzea albidocapillata]|uniref:Transcriptional regulators n=1 Tax=Lentzea albidocapillata TaxID=40571 RepID=A0A1W2FP95_9PSEU|nr:tyrosine-type recombinase/integrase [Lentzea albidocapillata]SMD23594.1 Transcriptional regulators [Lentzea albidocapillata]
MGTSKQPKGRDRGGIEPLPSGALRVSVYAGVDPLTNRRNYLRETIPAGPTAEKEAEKVKTRFLNMVDEQRNPRTKATVNKLMDRYLELLDVDTNTRKGYEGYIRNHVRPLLGNLQVAKLDGETLDSFYTILRRCRKHCDGKPFVEHKTADKHECDVKRRQHTCKPLATSSIRQVHWCLSGALNRAKRWRWITVNPLDQAEKQKAVKPNPKPPTSSQAAAIINEAFKISLAWGTFVWMAFVTGARRGEQCAFRLDLLDLAAAVLPIASSIAQDGSKTWEKDTKTHQQRRNALDAVTVMLLQVYLLDCEEKAKEFGVKIKKDGRLFSPDLDHSTWFKPDTVSQRFTRMCKRLGLDVTIQNIRHYTATELIAGGADVRTVAGRLGHGGGGSTTLRVYSAWVSEADQRAAGTLMSRMPELPIKIDETGTFTTKLEPTVDHPYQKIAADLRGAIACGALKPGDLVPTVIELKARYGASAGTANRAIAELKAAGLVNASRGKRAVVLAPGEEPDVADVVSIKRKRKAE